MCSVSVNTDPNGAIDIPVYEVENNRCSFKKAYQIKENNIFFFGISSFVLEILAVFILKTHYPSGRAWANICSSSDYASLV